MRFELLRIIVFVVLWGVFVCAVAAGVWHWAAPVAFARMLRKSSDGPPQYPEDYEARLRRIDIKLYVEYPSQYGRNSLNLYLTKTDKDRLPVVIWVHGGSFVAGEKEEIENWTASLASEGIVVAAVEYQRAPEASWPAQLIQIGECCRFLQQAAERYKLDMEKVAIAGDSAGAHMAAQFALVHANARFREQAGLQAVLRPEALKAALLYCGPYELGIYGNVRNKKLRFFVNCIGWCYFGKRKWKNTTAAKLCTIKHYVTPQFPPTYITDGNTFSFEAHGRALVQALREQNVWVKERFFAPEAEKVTHGYRAQMREPCAKQCYQDTRAFLHDMVLL